MQWTTETFVKFLEDKYGVGYYDYSKVVYITRRTPVIIICPVHGEQTTLPDTLLAESTKSPCRICSREQRAARAAFTTEEFIQKSKEIWGEEHYDYSKVVYKNNSTPVTLICKYHNHEFSQIPLNHLNHEGCEICLTEIKKQKRTLDENKVIQRFKEKFGDKFDYSKVEYKGMHEKFFIVHKECGQGYWITPDSFLRGAGKCPYCEISLKKKHEKLNEPPKNLTEIYKENFIEKSKSKFGNKFDYSKVEYINSKTEIILIDKSTKEEFSIRPKDHLLWSNGKYKEVYSIEKEKEKFIQTIINNVGDIYDFNLMEYVDAETPVKLICKTCGEVFDVKPASLKKSKHCLCPNCRQNRYISSNNTPIYNNANLTTSEFIKRALTVHGDLYDYSSTVYTSFSNKITFKCKTCGHTMDMLPANHLSGQGCKFCHASSKEKLMVKILDELGFNYEFHKRFSDLKSPKGKPLEIDFYIPEIKLCIEYQGQQHYKPVDFERTKKKNLTREKKIKMLNNLQSQQKRDQLKRDYCFNNGFYLLEIPYNKYWNYTSLKDFLNSIVVSLRENPCMTINEFIKKFKIKEPQLNFNYEEWLNL